MSQMLLLTCCCGGDFLTEYLCADDTPTGKVRAAADVSTTKAYKTDDDLCVYYATPVSSGTERTGTLIEYDTCEACEPPCPCYVVKNCTNDAVVGYLTEADAAALNPSSVYKREEDDQDCVYLECVDPCPDPEEETYLDPTDWEEYDDCESCWTPCQCNGPDSPSALTVNVTGLTGNPSCPSPNVGAIVINRGLSCFWGGGTGGTLAQVDGQAPHITTCQSQLGILCQASGATMWVGYKTFTVPNDPTGVYTRTGGLSAGPATLTVT